MPPPTAVATVRFAAEYIADLKTTPGIIVNLIWYRSNIDASQGGEYDVHCR